MSGGQFWRPVVWGVAALIVAIALFTSGYALASHHSSVGMDHQAMIEATGAEVMPFDQNKTTHIFQKTDPGGMESVIANDGHDQQQIGLIRSHLQDEATKFTQGNYEDPARIHGMDMPGLKELEVGYTRVHVVYADLVDGGNITYTSTDPVLVEAIHAWFDRQLQDHGAHAAGG